MIARSKEDVKEITDIIKETKKLKTTTPFLSNKANILYLFTIGLGNRLLNEMNEVNTSFSELIIEMENNPELITELPNFYILAHGYLIRYFAIKKQYNDGFKMIDKLKSLSLNKMFSATDLQIAIFTQSHITEMVLYAYIGQHQQATNIIPYVIKGLDKYETKINDEDLVMIYHTISMVYFGVGDYNKALHWLNKIINTNYEDLREDNIRICKLINLIIHFELGNDDLITYIYKSTLRFFNQQEKQYKFEMVFLDYYKKIALSKKEGKQKETYIKFKQELQIVFKNKYEKNALEFFNFYAWLDSKIHNITFAEAIKIRRQNV
jgi:tetratricopeptide (TPR) repeat protein